MMKSHKVPGRARGGWRIAAAGAAVIAGKKRREQR